MTKPKVSVCTLTYGRPHRLQEAVACFLGQDYEGQKEMIIVNDFEAQNIFFDHPCVKVINLPRRIDTIGQKRNYAISLCSGEVILTYDDDDIILRNHISKCMSLLGDLEWAMPDKGIFLTKDGTKVEFCQSFLAQFVFRKSAWEKLGGYSQLNFGEDQDFVARLRKDLNGLDLKIGYNDITYLFSWDNGDYHLQGYGEDKSNSSISLDIIKETVLEKIRNYEMPSGNIRLVPEMRFNYDNIVKDLAAAVVNYPKQDPVASWQMPDCPTRTPPWQERS